ncbi:DUF3558 domain-containing protein [Nocardia macrotermitis]|uniref:DUF3558 domain-containing protein n=1 Tax=Nocardia macrotermitis TaxID=2585198 RepID=UPI001885DAEA|nr:DUF3558 domain-containing protein [Nocardia macrotermitis]
MRALAVAAGVCAVLAVAGCNKSDSGSSAASPTKLTEAQLWDPCTLSDSAVKATGVDPSTKNTNVFGVAQAGWKACAWNNDDYFLAVHSTVHTMDEVRSNDSFKNIHNVDVSGREAISYNDESDSCGVDFPTSKGVVEVIIRKSGTSNASIDYCAIALKSAGSLNSSIPK